MQDFAATWPQDPASSVLDPALRKSLTFWTRLHGILSLQAAGHFAGMPFDPASLYAEEVQSLVTDLK